jgi:hypothetical protein
MTFPALLLSVVIVIALATLVQNLLFPAVKHDPLTQATAEDDKPTEPAPTTSAELGTAQETEAVHADCAGA